jgi:hypothetical protein
VPGVPVLSLGGGGEAVPDPVGAGQGARLNHIRVSTMERPEFSLSFNKASRDRHVSSRIQTRKELSRQPTYLTILICYNSLITIDGVLVVPQCLVSQCCPWKWEVRQFLSHWAQGRRHIVITSGVTTMERLDRGPSIKHPETDMTRPGFELRLPASQAGTLPKSYRI